MHHSISLPPDVILPPGKGNPVRNRSDTVQSKTPMMEKAFLNAETIHSHMRNPTEPTFFSSALRSDNPDVLSLPFRLSIEKSRGQTQRNIPYLRHSWTRIDFVAIVSFWITFALATGGVERSTYHIGIFRSMSVLRTARLLAITSGTTTIMRSLKTARPLLASVAYFVLFAMILFSIIGIQSFQGSFRRTCHLLPTQGEGDISLDSQFCGAYLDPDTLEVKGYINDAGENVAPKGYVCPLGQICKSLYPLRTAGHPYVSNDGLGILLFVLLFIVCIVVLNFWLINLFVAVITNTFSAIRSDTKKSAFGAAPLAPIRKMILSSNIGDSADEAFTACRLRQHVRFGQHVSFPRRDQFPGCVGGRAIAAGDVAQGNFIDFGTLYNSYLAIYQVFSSENWTDVLYGAAEPEIPLRQSAIVILFFSGWMFFANYIVLQMFIAVINENFDVAEESKRSRQASHYWASHRPQAVRAPWKSSYPNLVLPMQKTLVQDYDFPKKEDFADGPALRPTKPRQYSAMSSLRRLQALFSGETTSNDVPLTTLRNGRRDSVAPQDPVDEETERHLEVLAALNTETAEAEDLNDVLYERRAQKADFIRDHPTYDKTFWIFSQKNIIRRICQKLVAPAGGDRIFGTPHSSIAHPIFQLLLLLTVIGGIVTEIIATPIYRRTFYSQHGHIRGAWFDLAEAAFASVLLLEFLIKIIADGFTFTPNAYIRSIWNVLDFFILIGILVNATTGLIFIGGLSRLTRSLKALRALRLITLIDKMRSTFESLIISGIARILDAALLAILYMIPYAVWGLNIFSGLTNECNDSSVTGISDCTGEYTNTVYGNSFGFLVPRVWDNPSPSTTFSFDSFRQSLLILFEIVSLEGWIDVMSVASSITGQGLQPQTNASLGNSIFFLIYNLLGGVVILTLFVSIIIGNFTSKTGSALLTQPQREWIDLQKLIKRQRPSRRPKRRPTWWVREWCFDRAVHKHGWWHRMMTILFILHVFVLMTQTFTPPQALDEFRNDFFIIVTLVYVVDILVRLFGLGWPSYSANGWNLFDIIVAGGSLLTTLIVRFSDSGASLPVILSLLGLWLILFMFFAILFVEVFSLTKWNTSETRNMNYSSMSKALVMLAFMTTGEGWNQYMHDLLRQHWLGIHALYRLESPSMYIFANLFTGVVVESFYYVFQMSGGAKAITREEMRAFKKVWAEFANPKTGYLERARFVPFFGKLSGIFEVRIYPTDYHIPRILALSNDPQLAGTVTEGLDVSKLNVILCGIDRASTKRRKNLYNRLYHEARISHEPGKGISFTNMLLLLAHHKLIVDREALVLKDLVVRTETNKLVTDLVDFDRVQSLLLMILYRRRYLAQREQARLQQIRQQDIPAIVVESLPTTPVAFTRDITSPGQETIRRFADIDSPLSSGNNQSPDMSFGLDSPSHSALQRRQRTSDLSMLSIDMSNSPSRVILAPRTILTISYLRCTILCGKI
ncbi:Calcium-channel protein cch1 [Grifola frondosa]|uniref:Calcium-channel protein cch1 n=1 Tax=Grifola frondosa TaxID=5627 RepID=A0A1C7MDL1_GRIFR|nr:Calcium-channel protein cch1 [Grifola frondosa]